MEDRFTKAVQVIAENLPAIQRKFLLAQACEVDNYGARAHAVAVNLTAACAEFALRVEQGYLVSMPPATRWYEVATLNATYRARAGALVETVYHLTRKPDGQDSDLAKQFRDLVGSK
jgi:hypothetical protein